MRQDTVPQDKCVPSTVNSESGANGLNALQHVEVVRGAGHAPVSNLSLGDGPVRVI